MNNTLRNILLLGTKVNVFEKDGFETETGVIVDFDDKHVFVHYKNCSEKGIFKIPLKGLNFEIRLTTRGNSLEQYKVKDQ